MAALSRQKINITIETNGELIVYAKAAQAKAILSAKEKRAAGTPVETILKDDTKTNEDYQNYAKRNRISLLSYLRDHPEIVKILNGYQEITYDMMIESVKQDGLRIYGFSIVCQKGKIIAAAG